MNEVYPSQVSMVVHFCEIVQIPFNSAFSLSLANKILCLSLSTLHVFMSFVHNTFSYMSTMMHETQLHDHHENPEIDTFLQEHHDHHYHQQEHGSNFFHDDHIVLYLHGNIGTI